MIDDDETPPKKLKGTGRTPLQINVAKATKLKQTYNSTIAGCMELMNALKTKKDYANMLPLGKTLENMLIAVQKEVADGFASDWLLMDPKDVKKKWGDDEVSVEAKNLVGWLEYRVTQLNDERLKLMNHVRIG